MGRNGFAILVGSRIRIAAAKLISSERKCYRHNRHRLKYELDAIE